MASNSASPSKQINREDPFSFDFYLNQSPEQKQEQPTLSFQSQSRTNPLPHFQVNQDQHHHHHHHHHNYTHSPPDSQSSSTSLSPVVDDHQSSFKMNLDDISNDQLHHYHHHHHDQFDASHHHSSYTEAPFMPGRNSSVALSRSSSVNKFGSNSLGLQGDEMSLEFNGGRDGNGEGEGGFGSVKMSHSESAPNFSFIQSQHQHELDRRDSFLSNCSSSPSTSSTLSLANSYSSSYNGANSLNQHFKRSKAASHQNGGGSVSPASYISNTSLSLPSPCPSPLGLPHALSSISGLAIIDGGNGNPSCSDSNSTSSASSPQANPHHHHQLLALSSDGESNEQNLGMPLELNLGMSLQAGSNGNGGSDWNERWNSAEEWGSSQRSSPSSTHPTLGNALGLASSHHESNEVMDQDEIEEMEEDDGHGHPSKRRAPPGANDIEEALPSPARSTAASKEASSPAFRTGRPLGAILKRRATSTQIDEITPVALSRPSFAGQTSTAASDLIRHRHSVSNGPSHQVSYHPQTPRSDSLPTNSLSSAISMTPGMQTPASSHSVTATPDYSTLSLSTPSSAMKRSSSYSMGSSYSGHSDYESPVHSMLPPRLQRGQSYSGLALGMSKSQELTDASPNSDLPIGLPAHLQFGRNLERVMSDEGSIDEEHGLGIAGNGMVPLSPFRSPSSRLDMSRTFSSSSVGHNPPHSAGISSSSFSMAHLAAESPARMQRSQSLGMGGATYSHPLPSPYTPSSSASGSEGVAFSSSAPRMNAPSGLGYPFTYGSSVPSTPNAPPSNLHSSAYYTAPTNMKLTMSKGASRRKAAPPPLIVSSTGKAHACHCGKRFRRAEHLKRHQRAHTEEKPHLCVLENCGKAFGRSDNLAQHLKTHFKHVTLSKDDLKRLMEDAKLLGTAGIASELASDLEYREKQAAKFAPPVAPKRKASTRKRNQDGNPKDNSKPSNSNKNQTSSQYDSNSFQNWVNVQNQGLQSPIRQALSPTGSATANSPGAFLPF